MPADRNGPLKYDSVIIGSGITGLTAALVLAQNGRRVALIEKSGHIAPLLRRFKRGNVWCDPGFHYSGGLEESGSLSVIFRYLRMREDIRSVPMNKDGYDILFHRGREIPIPCGIDRVKDTLCRYFPKSKKAVCAYIEKVDSLMDSTPFINFNLNYDDFPRDTFINESLDKFLDAAGAEEELKELIGLYGRLLYGVSGNEVPFYIHALVMGPFYRSAQTLAHGGDEIVDAFKSRLRQEGVDILCSSPAAGIEVDHDRRLKGIKVAGGDLLECDSCVSTIHPSLLIDILPADSVRPAYISRLKGLENTAASFAVYLEVDDVPEKIAHTNLYRLKTANKASTRDSVLSVMACDPQRYDNKQKGLCILRESPSNKIPRDAYGIKKRTDIYREYKERETEDSVRQMLEFFPEIMGRAKVVDSSTHFTYERYTGTPDGSMYGVKQSVNQIKLSSMTSIRGFYLAGQSILMPGVMGGAVSGFLGASNIIGLETLWNEVREWR